MRTRSKSDQPWWLNPSYIVEGTVEMDGLATFPSGSVALLDRQSPQTNSVPVSVEHGEFASLAAILFMINGHRPGPMRGFYVVVEVVKGKTWGVGQMQADSVTPLCVFSDHLYDSEAAARAAAEAIRLADVGNAPPRA